MQRLNLLDLLMTFHSPIRLTHSIRFTPPFEWLLLNSFLTQLGTQLLRSPELFSRLRHEAATGTSAFLLSKAQRLRLTHSVSCVSLCWCCSARHVAVICFSFVPSRDECVYLFSRVRCRKQLACANGRVDGARFSATTPYTATLGRCLLVSLLLAFLVQRPGASSSTSANAAYECAVVAMCAVARRKWSHCASLAAKNESDLCLNEICLHNVQVKRT